MKNRELIKELVEKAMVELEEQDYARPLDGAGLDKYDSDKEEHIEGFKRYMKLEDIMKYLKMKDWKPSRMTTKLMKETLTRVPDWKDIIQELVEQEMKRLESYDYARPLDGAGCDKYDSDKKEHAEGFNKYCKLRDMHEKLVRDKQNGEPKQTLFDRLKKKKKKTFLDDNER